MFLVGVAFTEARTPLRIAGGEGELVVDRFG